MHWVTLEEGLAPHVDVLVICNDTLQQLARAVATAADSGCAQEAAGGEVEGEGKGGSGSEPPPCKRRRAAAAAAAGHSDGAPEPSGPPMFRACVHRVARAAEPRLSLSWELRVGGEAARAEAVGLDSWWRAVAKQATAASRGVT